MEGLGANFFGSYAAVRFATGKRHPGIIGPLFKAAALITWMTVLFPIALLQLLLSVRIKPQRPTTAGGYPRRFADHINDLQEDMK